MAKHVFRPTEIVNLSRKVFIEPPRKMEVKPEPEDIKTLDDFEDSGSGPSIDDLRREREDFQKNWERERQELLSAAQKEAEQIIKEAEELAFNEVKKRNNDAKKIKQEAEDEAKVIIKEAEEAVQLLESQTKTKVNKIEQESYSKGYEEGHAQGFQAGKEEMERLIERIHLVLNTAIEKRNEIIENSETQIINLVLLIAKKVIKVISENQKNVVINNVVQALRKLKSRGDVVIRVNLTDLELTTEHIKEFMKLVENVKSVTVLEDSTVDKGGCIIETDFGQIDARISSQISEIEEKIIELMPIKTKG